MANRTPHQQPVEEGIVKKITPEKAPRKGATQLNLSARDWAAILEGGVFELEAGTDFTGSIGGANQAVRDILVARMGTWRLSEDKKNGTITVTVTKATAES
jgi:hypothetical protein